MTVPLTRDISDFAYEIDYKLSGDFVCCTLNGLLWLYKDKTDLILIALKYDTQNGRFELAETQKITREKQEKENNN